MTPAPITAAKQKANPPMTIIVPIMGEAMAWTPSAHRIAIAAIKYIMWRSRQGFDLG